MADGKSVLPSTQQYEALKVPSEWTGEQKRFATRLIEILDDIYRHFGRLRIEDLEKGFRKWIEDVDGNMLEIIQTAQGLVARVTDAEGSISEIQLTTDGLAAAVKNNRLRFSEKGLEIINAAGDVVFSQDNATGNLTVSGILRALGGVIGGFTIGDSSLSSGNKIVLDALNGLVRLGQLTVTDSLTFGPVLQAVAGLSFVVGGALYMALGNDGVTVQRTLYAQSGLYISPSRTTDKPANLYVDPATGEVMRTTNTGGGGSAPGGLAASLSLSRYGMTAAQVVDLYGGASGGSAPYTYSFAASYEGGAYLPVSGVGDVRSYQPHSAGRYVFRVIVTDADGNSATAFSGTLTVTETADALDVFIGAEYTQVGSGKNITWTAYVSGGSGSYLYSVVIYRDGLFIDNYDIMPVSKYYTQPGTYYVMVDVVDAVTMAVKQTTGGYVTV